MLEEAALVAVDNATAHSTEEAVPNAMFTADTMPTHRPPGPRERIDIGRLRTLLDLHRLLHIDLTTTNLH